MEILLRLPVDLAHEVFMYLTADQIVVYWNSNNSKLRTVMNSNYFWKVKSKSEKYQESQDLIRYKTFEKYLTNCLLYWQKIYICGVLNKRLDFNWKNAVYKKNVFELTSLIKRIDYFDDEITIARAFYNNAILVISSSTGTIEHTFQVERAINKIIKNEDYLIALLRDNIIRVWDLKSKSLLLSKDFDNSIIIRCLHKHWLGVYIETIGIVILNLITKSFDIKIDSGICIDFDDDDKFAAGTMDAGVELYDSNFDILWEFTCCEEKPVTNIRVLKDNLLIVHFDEICFWNITSKEKLHSIDGVICLYRNRHNRIKLLENDNTVLLGTLSTTYDRSIERFDFIAGKRIFKIDIDETTYDVTSNNNFVFSIKRNYIYIWCIKTGKFANRIKITDVFTLYHAINMKLFLTETKLAYLLNYKDLHVLNYENFEKLNLSA